jgi:hypothetical protein
MKTHWLNIAVLTLVVAILADRLTQGRRIEELLANNQER